MTPDTQPAVKPVDPAELAQIRQWAENHLLPDVPLLVAGASAYSPRQVVSEIEAGTPVGVRLLNGWRDNQPKNG